MGKGGAKRPRGKGRGVNEKGKETVPEKKTNKIRGYQEKKTHRGGTGGREKKKMKKGKKEIKKREGHRSLG